MKKVLNLFILICVLAGFTTLNNCKKEESRIKKIIPPSGVTTGPVLAISSNRAVLGSEVADIGGAVWMIRGICYDIKTDPYPDIDSSDFIHLEKIYMPGSFIDQMSGLLPSTTYYVRAYAANEAGFTYGNQVSFTTYDAISDIEGRTYGTGKIGMQVWMTENLKTSKYNDGTSIPLVEYHTDWCALTDPGHFIFSWILSDDEVWDETLYNWHSVSTGKLCPAGWHIPSDTEWLALAYYIGLRSHKWDGNFKKTFGYTFDARNTVIRDTIEGINGWKFFSARLDPQWWSSTSYYSSTAWYFILNTEIDTMRLEYSKKYGLPVRCIKDY